MRKKISTEMQVLRDICNLGNSIRGRHKIRKRQVLKRVKVYVSLERCFIGRSFLENRFSRDLLIDELNVLHCDVLDDHTVIEFAEQKVIPNSRNIGADFKEKTSEIVRKIKKGEYKEANGCLFVSECRLEKEHYSREFVAKKNEDNCAYSDGIFVYLDLSQEEILDEHTRKLDLIRNIQRIRKENNFNIEERIGLKLGKDNFLLKNDGYIISENEDARQFISRKSLHDNFKRIISDETLCNFEKTAGGKKVVIGDGFEIFNI